MQTLRLRFISWSKLAAGDAVDKGMFRFEIFFQFKDNDANYTAKSSFIVKS